MLTEYSIEMRFLLCVLATWRVSHFFVLEDGPWDIVVKLRIWLGDSVVGSLMDCFYCTSVWIALPITVLIAYDLWSWIVLWPALSGAAALLEQASQRETTHAHSSHNPNQQAEK